MYGFNNMLGIILDKNYLNRLSDEEKGIIKVYIKICEAVIEKNIIVLEKEIPNIKIKNILNESKSKSEWIEDIKKENIKYYGIELLNTKITINKNIAEVKSKNKIRAKIFNYRGSFIKTSYMNFIKENEKLKINDFCI